MLGLSRILPLSCLCLCICICLRRFLIMKAPRAGEWVGARGTLLTMAATLNTSKEPLQSLLLGNKMGV